MESAALVEGRWWLLLRCSHRWVCCLLVPVLQWLAQPRQPLVQGSSSHGRSFLLLSSCPQTSGNVAYIVFFYPGMISLASGHLLGLWASCIVDSPVLGLASGLPRFLTLRDTMQVCLGWLTWTWFWASVLQSLVPSRVVWIVFNFSTPLSPELWWKVHWAPELVLTEVCTLLRVLSTDGGTADAVPQEMVIELALLLAAAEWPWEREIHDTAGWHRLTGTLGLTTKDIKVKKKNTVKFQKAIPE